MISPHLCKVSASTRTVAQWKKNSKGFSSTQFSHSVVSDFLWPHESQHARPPCPSPTPGVYPNPCPLSWWCHPTISSSAIPFSSYPQSFPASGSSRSLHEVDKVLAFRHQHHTFQWIPRTDLPLGRTGWIFLQSKWLSRVFSNTTAQSIILLHSSFFILQLSHPYMTTGKNHSLD